MGNTPYSGVSEKKVAQRNQVLNKELEEVRKYANDESPIIDSNAHQLIQSLNSGKLTSLQIVSAFALRAGTKGLDYCLITQSNFKYALQRARQCDKHRKQTGKKNWTFKDGQYNQDKFLPPLYGIPISIKDVYHMEGFSTTIGIKCRANQVYPQSPLIKCLKTAGLIPFVRTNIPQFGMTSETVNNLWGRSLNPWNKDRCVGGSSGGEGGLLAAKGSPIGVGSDIGGSLRIPAQFCGIFSLKPFSKRFSAAYHTQMCSAFTGMAYGIPLCLGPMGRSTEDLALWMKVATDQSYYQGSNDPYIKNIPFNDQEYLGVGKKKYTIGYFKSFEIIQCTQTSKRAINETLQILQKLGHEIVEIKIPNQTKVLEAFFISMSANGGEMFKEILKGQEQIGEYKTLFSLASMGSVKHWAVSGLLNRFMPRMGKLVQSIKTINTMEYQTHLGDIFTYKNQWIKYWKENKLDFVIAPGFGSPATLHTKSSQTSLAASYAFVWNVLDVTVGSLPVTLTRENQENYESVYNDKITNELRENLVGAANTPVGIQIVGLPYSEEKVLGLMKILEDQIKFYEKHPLPKI